MTNAYSFQSAPVSFLALPSFCLWGSSSRQQSAELQVYGEVVAGTVRASGVCCQGGNVLSFMALFRLFGRLDEIVRQLTTSESPWPWSWWSCSDSTRSHNSYSAAHRYLSCSLSDLARQDLGRFVQGEFRSGRLPCLGSSLAQLKVILRSLFYLGFFAHSFTLANFHSIACEEWSLCPRPDPGRRQRHWTHQTPDSRPSSSRVWTECHEATRCRWRFGSVGRNSHPLPRYYLGHRHIDWFRRSHFRLSDHYLHRHPPPGPPNLYSSRLLYWAHWSRRSANRWVVQLDNPPSPARHLSH